METFSGMKPSVQFEDTRPGAWAIWIAYPSEIVVRNKRTKVFRGQEAPERVNCANAPVAIRGGRERTSIPARRKISHASQCVVKRGQGPSAAGLLDEESWSFERALASPTRSSSGKKVGRIDVELHKRWREMQECRSRDAQYHRYILPLKSLKGLAWHRASGIYEGLASPCQFTQTRLGWAVWIIDFGRGEMVQSIKNDAWLTHRRWDQDEATQDREGGRQKIHHIRGQVKIQA
ncbi:hypothetical protein B0H16DRAFT_1476470 [Mycena metata]|uniref:Uncharacterized protein n=1 Tax=Mycena metata TaxID=1033252 RepID=A0AAD7HBA2_9AGAR|nr:hypothetical protein B0H16DRAFT_1476470 [Mycena metata]